MKARAALTLTLALAGCTKAAPQEATKTTDSPGPSQPTEPAEATPSPAEDAEVSEPVDPAQQVATRAKAAANARDAFADVELGTPTEMAPGVFMTMFKASESNPVDGGWHRGTSTHGDFSIELPMPFNDFRITAEASDGGDLQTDTVGAKTPGLLAYSATCITSSAEFPEGQCEKTLRKLGRSTAIEGDKNGMTGMQAEVERAHGQCWISPDSKRTCFLIIESQGDDPMPEAAERTRFFDSFEPG